MRLCMHTIEQRIVGQSVFGLTQGWRASGGQKTQRGGGQQSQAVLQSARMTNARNGHERGAHTCMQADFYLASMISTKNAVHTCSVHTCSTVALRQTLPMTKHNNNISFASIPMQH